jgi:dipeptidyl aminopeptidase/acylaminoacyl peptidase
MKARVSAALIFLVIAPAARGQDGFLVPGDNLILQGIPKVPLGLVQKVARYTDFRSATHTDWHPKNPEMLILTRFADTAQVHHVAMPGGARTQLTFEKDSVMGASYEPREGKYFIFIKGAGGGERFQLYRYDLDTGRVTLLTDGKSRNSGPTWNHKGDRIAYTSTRRNGADTDLYVMDPTDPKTDRLVQQLKGGGWAVLDWSPDDGRLLLGEYVSINESYLNLFDLAKQTMTRITPGPGKEPIAYAGGKFTPDGTALYVLTDKDSEFRYLARLDLAGGQLKAVVNDAGNRDVDGFALSRDGRNLAVLVNDHGAGQLNLFRDLHPVKLPGDTLQGSVGGAHWHPDGKRLALHLTSARSPGDVYSVDIDTLEVRRWTTSETGGLVTKDFVEPKRIEWKSFDDRTITGFLYAPPAKFSGKRPVIIDIHGGPEAQFRPRFLGRNNYFLDEMGVALIYPNIRGSSGFGKTFLSLDNGFRREDSYRDIGALLDWIKTRPDLDADRVMVTGGSYGGHMTLAVATYYPDRIRCAVDVVGISNLRTFLENTEPYRRDLRRVEYGDERDPKMRAFLDKIAPLTNAHKIKAPLFIVHGANDPRVPLSEAEQIRDILKKQGTPVWFLVARDEGHGFAKKRNADFQFYATVQFVEQYLLK